MYDSITSHLVRLARRSWFVIVVALVIGAVLGGLVSSQRQSWTGTAVIQITDVSTTASLLALGGGLGIGTGASVLSLATRAEQDFEATATDTTIAATADATAGLVIAVATGPDNEAVRDALDDFEQIIERRATDLRVDEVDAALRANDTTLERFEADLAALNDQLASLDPNDPAREAVAQSRADLESDIREVATSSRALRQYRDFLETDLVTTIGLSVKGPSTGVTSMIVGVIGMAILLTVLGAALVVSDHRIRRRLQLERLLPGVPILAVLPLSAESNDDAREAARSIDRLVEKTKSNRGFLVGLGGTDSKATISALQPLTATTLAELDDDSLFDDALFVVAATWGRTTENEIAARVAALETAGSGHVAVIIVGVPPRDLDWAGATGRGADLPSQ